MNKLTTKLVGIALGTTMAIGVGVAAAKMSNEPIKRAQATDYNVADFADLETGDIGVIVGNNGSNYAMSNGNGTGSAPSAVAVTVAGGKITSAVTSAMLWEVTKTGSNYQFKVPNTSTYLYCTNNNNGLRVGTNNDNVFVIESDYLKNSAQSRFVGIYNSSDWRSYTSINNNIKDQTFKFYVQQSSGATQLTTPEPTYNKGAGTVSWTVDSDADHYEVSVNGGAFDTATSPFDVSDLDYGTNKIDVIAKGDGTNFSDSEVGSVTFANLEHAGTQADPYNVRDARAAIDDTTGTLDLTEKYGKGIVSRITTAYDSSFHNVSFDMSDDGEITSGQLRGFRTVGTEEYPIDSEDSVQVGDTVILFGDLTKYNSTYEFAAGNELVYLDRPVLESIEISGSMTKTAYDISDSWDPTGLTVTASYSNGDTEDVTSSVTWSYDPATPTAMGATLGSTLDITATYDGQTDITAETVSVTAPSYDDDYNLAGTHYIFEQQTSGGTRYYMNIDSATSSVKPAAVTTRADASAFLFTLVGDNTFTITNADGTKGLYHTGNASANTSCWGAAGVSYHWVVNDTQAGELYGDYNFIGQTSEENQRYLCVYNNTDWRTYNSATAANRKAMIQVETPKEVSGFSVYTAGADKNVLKGTTFDATAAAAAGFEARINYTDSTYDDVTADATWTLNTSVVNNNATLTVSYESYTPVEITGMNVYAVVITDLTIDTTNAKTTGYFVGDTLDTTGLVITGTDAGDNEYPIEISSCTFAPTLLTSAGSQTITVTYTNEDSSEAVSSYTVTVANSTYVKASSINGGDRIILAYESEITDLKKYMNGISTTSTKYGTVADYTSMPDTSDAMLLDVVAGSDDGTFAFKTASGQFLTWTSGNSLNVASTKSANTSWTVSFEDGLATIINASTIGAAKQRYLGYNAGSPRFACYESNYANVTIWKLNGSSAGTAAETFANDFYADVVEDICAAFGPTFEDDMPAMWELYGEAWDALDPETRAYIASKTANASGDIVEKMLYEYKHIYETYGTELSLENFMGRIEVTKVSGSRNMNANITKYSSAITAVVVVFSVLSITTLGGYFLLRKKKEER